MKHTKNPPKAVTIETSLNISVAVKDSTGEILYEKENIINNKVNKYTKAEVKTIGRMMANAPDLLRALNGLLDDRVDVLSYPHRRKKYKYVCKHCGKLYTDEQYPGIYCSQENCPAHIGRTVLAKITEVADFDLSVLTACQTTPCDEDCVQLGYCPAEDD